MCGEVLCDAGEHRERWALAKKVTAEIRVEADQNTRVRFASEEVTTRIFKQRIGQVLEAETLVDIT